MKHILWRSTPILKKQVLWRWHHPDAWVSSWQYFLGFCRKSLPAHSLHSNGYPFCPSSRRYLSVFIRSGIYTGFALNEKETVSISVQSHLQVNRWCNIHKQPRVWKKYLGQMYPPELETLWHYREHHSRFLPRFTTFDWERWSTFQ